MLCNFAVLWLFVNVITYFAHAAACQSAVQFAYQSNLEPDVSKLLADVSFAVQLAYQSNLEPDIPKLLTNVSCTVQLSRTSKLLSHTAHLARSWGNRFREGRRCKQILATPTVGRTLLTHVCLTATK